MTTSANFKRSKKLLQDSGQLIKFGSPDHQRILEGGYGMTKEQAEIIVKERDANSMAHPYDDYRLAKSFLLSLKATPKVISKSLGHRRPNQYGMYGETA